MELFPVPAQLTELLQRVLVVYMREQFSGRLHIIKTHLPVEAGLSEKEGMLP